MRLLFQMDAKDYDPGGKVFARPSARGIIIRGGRIAMVHSARHDYYKFPGGGIGPAEERTAALIRETREEVGLIVIPSSIRAYGYVHRVEKGKDVEVFVQDNFYHFCAVEPGVAGQRLDAYEAREQYALAYVAPQTAIAANRRDGHAGKNRIMLEREARVLELLMGEGYFG